jgi:hypothetical protein
MNLNSENKQVIHEVLMADMQKRLYEDYYTSRRGKVTQVTDEDYDNELSVMVNEILHCSSISDINDVLVKYNHYLPNEYLTLDGTLNYVIALLAK